MRRTGKEIIEEETMKFLNDYKNAYPYLSIENFQGVALEDLHIVEQIAKVNLLAYDTEVSESGITGELAEISLRQSSFIGNLLRSNNFIRYVTDVKKVFKSLRFPMCDTSIKRNSNLKSHISKCEKLVRIFCPKTVYQLWGAPFDKFRPFVY